MCRRGGPRSDLDRIRRSQRGRASGPAAGDFDEDGTPDLVLIFASLHAARIYRGDGQGGFIPVASPASRATRS